MKIEIISCGAACCLAAAGAFAGGTLVKKIWLEKYRRQTEELTAAEWERDLLYSWFLLKSHGVDLREFFRAHGVKSVAVFGMNRLGRRAAEELEEMAKYAVESGRMSAVHEKLTVYRLGDDPLPPAEALLLCELDDVSVKREKAQAEFSGRVISLAEAISWLIQKHNIRPKNGAIADWPPEKLMK